jgi:hypothetical protein
MWGRQAGISLCQDVVDYFTVDVGQTIVAAGVAEGELLVVESQEVQDRGVEVVNVDSILANGDPEFVRRAIGDSPLHATSGKPRRKNLVMVFATCVIRLFVVGSAAELGGPDDQRFVEHSSIL